MRNSGIIRLMFMEQTPKGSPTNALSSEFLTMTYWNSVSMQVDWKLEPLYSYSDAAMTQKPAYNVHSTPSTPTPLTAPPTQPNSSSANSPTPEPSVSLNNDTPFLDLHYVWISEHIYPSFSQDR